MGCVLILKGDDASVQGDGRGAFDICDGVVVGLEKEQLGANLRNDLGQACHDARAVAGHGIALEHDVRDELASRGRSPRVDDLAQIVDARVV
jgi:hypothetical protein